MQDIGLAALGDAGAQDIDKRSVFVAVQSIVGDLYPLRLGYRYAECGAARVDNVLKPVAAAEHRLSVFCGNDCRAHLVRERYRNALPTAELIGLRRFGDEIPAARDYFAHRALRNKRLGRAYLLERACLQTVNKGAEYPGLGRVCKAAHFALVGLRAAG